MTFINVKLCKSGDYVGMMFQSSCNWAKILKKSKEGFSRTKIFEFLIEGGKFINVICPFLQKKYIHAKLYQLSFVCKKLKFWLNFH